MFGPKTGMKPPYVADLYIGFVTEYTIMGVSHELRRAKDIQSPGDENTV